MRMFGRHPRAVWLRTTAPDSAPAMNPTTSQPTRSMSSIVGLRSSRRQLRRGGLVEDPRGARPTDELRGQRPNVAIAREDATDDLGLGGATRDHEDGSGDAQDRRVERDPFDVRLDVT